jgi:hypothetical protein
MNVPFLPQTPQCICPSLFADIARKHLWTVSLNGKELREWAGKKLVGGGEGTVEIEKNCSDKDLNPLASLVLTECNHCDSAEKPQDCFDELSTNGKILNDYKRSSVRPETCMMDVEFTASAPKGTLAEMAAVGPRRHFDGKPNFYSS